MLHTPFSFTRKGVNMKTTGDFFDKTDLSVITQYYNDWKALNAIGHNYNMRRLNVPELVTEGLASALFGWARVDSQLIQNSNTSNCDLVDIKTGQFIQLKAISTSEKNKIGPTSFGPSSTFDRLIFLIIECDKDVATFYDLSKQNYKSWKVNKNETVEDQQNQNRRPRLCLLPIIQQYNIQPFYTYSFREGIL